MLSQLRFQRFSFDPPHNPRIQCVYGHSTKCANSSLEQIALMTNGASAPMGSEPSSIYYLGFICPLLTLVSVLAQTLSPTVLRMCGKFFSQCSEYHWEGPGKPLTDILLPAGSLTSLETHQAMLTLYGTTVLCIPPTTGYGVLSANHAVGDQWVSWLQIPSK